MGRGEEGRGSGVAGGLTKGQSRESGGGGGIKLERREDTSREEGGYK